MMYLMEWWQTLAYLQNDIHCIMNDVGENIKKIINKNYINNNHSCLNATQISSTMK